MGVVFFISQTAQIEEKDKDSCDQQLDFEQGLISELISVSTDYLRYQKWQYQAHLISNIENIGNKELY